MTERKYTSDFEAYPESVRDALNDIPVVFTEDTPDFDVPDRWIIMNAPRPLMGDKEYGGNEYTFRHGRWYAVIDPMGKLADRMIKRNHDLDAYVIISECREKLVDRVLAGMPDRYKEILQQGLAAPEGSNKRSQAEMTLNLKLDKLNGMKYGDAV